MADGGGQRANVRRGLDGQAALTFRGYQVEFEVKKSALLNPADGAVLGFHLAANDDDGLGRKAQPGWSGRAHSEFTYGTLTLGGPVTPPTDPRPPGTRRHQDADCAAAGGGADHRRGDQSG
ncbi:MAG: hypothetical protein HS113_24020 [Verrucomicrobiales bacterium]|nr:hypothetical protein [Verrucomicrobiales bacterium]